MASIMTTPGRRAHVADNLDFELDAAPLAFAITRLTPDLWEPGLLPDETPLEREARHTAALDIWRDLLDECADSVAGV